MPPDDQPVTSMPYTVEYRAYGILKMPTKIMPDGKSAGILNLEEIQVWKYVQHLQAQLDELADAARPTSPAESVPTAKAKRSK